MTDVTTGADPVKFMATVREALERAKGDPLEEAPPEIDESVARLVRAEDDLLELFARNTVEAGFKLIRTRAAKVGAELRQLLESINARNVVTALGEGSASFKIDQAIREAGATAHQWQDSEGLDRQFDLDVGITDVHLAVAETGTIICCTDSEHGRGQSLVPPVHIAIVSAGRIVPDLLDCWGRIGEQFGTDLPSSINLITGPSKTSDIEGILTVGVHGPSTVCILLVEDG